MSHLPDLARLTVKELLLLEASIVTELRRRELRTSNKPIGDIAEHIVLNRPDFRSVLQVRMEHDEQEVFAGDA